MRRRICIAAALALGAACHGQLDFDDVQDGGASFDAGDGASPSSDCRTGAGCGLSTLHCDTASGACFACTGDSDCDPKTPRCDTALHRCVACGTAADCPPGQGCAQGVCLPSCSDAGTCTEPSVCNPASKTCGQCSADRECHDDGNAKLCQLGTGRCVACLGDTDCAPGHPRCDIITGQCARCLDTSDCHSAQLVCDPTTLDCVHR